MPTYNRAYCIEKSVASILKQNFTSWELIIIDDGSTDHTQTVLNELSRLDSRIQIYTQKNQGVSAARNLGIEKGIGQFFAFVDSDDEIEVNHLEVRKAYLDKEPEIEFMYGGWRVVGNPYVQDRNNSELLVHLEDSNVYGAGTFVIQAPVLRSLGGFPQVKYSEDGTLIELAFARGHKMKRCLEKTYIYNRESPDSICTKGLRA